MSVHFRPRAVIGTLRAQSGPAQVMAEIQSAFEDFKAHHNGHLNNTQKAIDDINARIAMGGAGNVVADPNLAPDPDYSRTYASFVRSGRSEDALKTANAEGHRAQVQAAMSTGSAGDGGYLAPTEWDRSINKALRAVTPMRRIANVVSTGVRAYTSLWNTAAWGSGWVGETASRPQTTTTSLAPIIYESGEIYAMPAITQQLLDDALFNVEGWISTELADEFTKQEGVAFIAGDGVNKPRGLLTYVTGGASAAAHPGGVLEQIPSGAAADIVMDKLVDLVYALPTPYRANGTWLMNSMTAARLSKMKDAGGNYLWRASVEVGQPATLLGYPVEFDENMPSVAAGNIPIAFGDFKRGYVVNDRISTRILRDPYTAKPYVLFYATKRVGGGVSDPNAIKLLKVAAS